jgi:hypothetical protein
LLNLLSLLAVIFFARPFFTNQIWQAIRRFKLENAETAATVYEFDKRPRILLLRSFYDDSVEVPHERSFSEAIFGLKLSKVRLEEAIVEVAYRYGPVGALQDPNAHLKPLGAARDLATNQDWQGHIHNALHDASIVMMVLGLTPGLRWELSRIRELSFLNKTIFIFPPTDRTDTGVIRETVQELLPSVGAVWNEKNFWPLLLFSDEAGQWHLAISDKQSEQDYQCALLLAIEFGGATMPASRRRSARRRQQSQIARGLFWLWSRLSAAINTVTQAWQKSAAQASSDIPNIGSDAFRSDSQKKPLRQLLYPAPKKPDEMKWLPWVGTAIGAVLLSLMLVNQSSSPSSTPLERPDPSSDSQALLKEDRPPIGADQFLEPAQLRYCMAEKLRLKAARNFMDLSDKSKVHRYGELVDDYNDRCASYLASQDDMDSAKEDVERHRLELETEGRARF